MILTYTLRPTTDRNHPVTVPDIDPAEATVNERLDAVEVAVTQLIMLFRYLDEDLNRMADVVDLLLETDLHTPDPDPATEQGATVGPRYQPHPTATDLALERNPELRGTHADPGAGR